jgi:hypothetical protein
VAREGEDAAARRGRFIAAGMAVVAASAFALGLVVGLMIAVDSAAPPGTAAGAAAPGAGGATVAVDPATEVMQAAQSGASPATEGAAGPAPPPQLATAAAVADPAPAPVSSPDPGADDPRAAFALDALTPAAWELDAGGFVDPADAQAVVDRIAAAGPSAFGAGGVSPVRVAAASGAPERSAVLLGPFRGVGSAADAAAAVRRIVGVDPLLRPAGSAP